MISVIICSIDEARYSAASRMYRELLAGEEHELIRIPDARSLAEGYNRGIAQSRGEVLIFSHDDIDILNPTFASRLKAHLSNFDVAGVAGTTKLARPEWGLAGPPHVFGQVAHHHPQGGFELSIFAAPSPAVGGICALDGLFIAARRAVVEKVQFDAATFDGFHHYDLDFTFAAHLAGFRLAVACDIHVLHHSRGVHDDAWRKYGARFMKKYHNKLAVMPVRDYQTGAIEAPTRELLARAMEEACPGGLALPAVPQPAR